MPLGRCSPAEGGGVGEGVVGEDGAGGENAEKDGEAGRVIVRQKNRMRGKDNEANERKMRHSVKIIQ